MDALQKAAEKYDTTLVLHCQPGTYATPGRPIVFIASSEANKEQKEEICKAITIGRTRLYDEDPRFGLIALSEIGSRALSPGYKRPRHRHCHNRQPGAGI